MKTAFVLLIAALCLASGTASAQRIIVGASPSSRSALDTYAAPGGSRGTSVPVAGLALPLTILESQSGYYKVELDGQPVWVKNTQVRVGRDSKASCAGTAEVRPGHEPVGATPGIMRNGC